MLMQNTDFILSKNISQKHNSSNIEERECLELNSRVGLRVFTTDLRTKMYLTNTIKEGNFAHPTTLELKYSNCLYISNLLYHEIIY